MDCDCDVYLRSVGGVELFLEEFTLGREGNLVVSYVIRIGGLRVCCLIGLTEGIF